MKTITLAVLAALSFAFAGIAGAESYSWDRTGAFPEGTVQLSAE